MSAPDRRTYTVNNDTARQHVSGLVQRLPDGWRVTIAPPGRTLDQNAAFHAICADFAKARPTHGNAPMDAEAWKSVLIVSHAAATDDGAIRLVPDLEGHGLVQIRESSARMSKARGSSLIEYCKAEAARLGVPLSAQEDRR